MNEIPRESGDSFRDEVCSSILEQKEIAEVLLRSLQEDYQTQNRQFPAAYLGNNKLRSRDVVECVKSKGKYKRITDVTDGGEAFKRIAEEFGIKPDRKIDSWFFIPDDTGGLEVNYLLEVKREGNCLIPVAHLPKTEVQKAKSVFRSRVGKYVWDKLSLSLDWKLWYANNIEMPNPSALREEMCNLFIPERKMKDDVWVQTAKSDVVLATSYVCVKFEKLCESIHNLRFIDSNGNH